jgi:hypothetical protein
MLLRDAIRWLAYPSVVAGALLLLAALRDAGIVVLAARSVDSIVEPQSELNLIRFARQLANRV